MNASSSSAGMDRAVARARRSTVLPALFIGVPLATAILAVLYSAPLRDSKAHEYVKNPVECVEVVMFCVALGALGTKLLRHVNEHRATRLNLLPDWDGKPIPVSEASAQLR